MSSLQWSRGKRRWEGVRLPAASRPFRRSPHDPDSQLPGSGGHHSHGWLPQHVRTHTHSHTRNRDIHVRTRSNSQPTRLPARCTAPFCTQSTIRSTISFGFQELGARKGRNESVYSWRHSWPKLRRAHGHTAGQFWGRDQDRAAPGPVTAPSH